MEFEDVAPTQDAEAWVKAAFARKSGVRGGSFALVLDAEDENSVVKLTRSKADYDALVHFSGTNPHFPSVTKFAENQGQGEAGMFHALLMEKLPNVYPQDAQPIANCVDRQFIGKDHPFGLLSAALALREGMVSDQYPASLADALEALGNYAREKMLLVELNQRSNWGQRKDGTLVAFDLVHTRKER